MSTDVAVKDAVELIIQGLQRDPASAQGTTHATARVDRGLTCIVTEGAWTLTSDVPSSGWCGRRTITGSLRARCGGIPCRHWDQDDSCQNEPSCQVSERRCRRRL